MQPARDEWAEAKRLDNLEKHVIDFLARFDWSRAVDFPDDRHEYGDDVDLSNLGPDDAPELTPEMIARAMTIFEIPEMAEFAAFIRNGGRPALPEKYRKPVTVLLDDEVIEHFKVGGEGWMERVNAALRKAAGLE